MQSDPIMDEVRRVRLSIERRYGSDPQAFYRHMRRAQRKLGIQVVSRSPRRLATSARKESVG